MSDEDLGEVLTGPATMITAASGSIGLLAIVFLMVFKPGS